MAHRLLRCLAGLPPGAAFSFTSRLTIGRAVDCDVQLVDPMVSRHHAKVEVDAEGATFLVDLASRAGTRVDGVSVHRAQLQHGATISIGGFRLRYEQTEVPSAERRTQRVGGMQALRVTATFEKVSRPRRSATPIPSAAPQAVPPTLRPDLPDTALIGAIVELRSGRSPSDGAVPPILGTEPTPGRRQHPRFHCSARGWLARREGDRVWTRPVATRDLAYGGACIEWSDDQTLLAPAMWLVFDTDEEQAPMVVFPSRLVWASPSSRTAGLAFVGAAGVGIDAIELIRAP